MKKTTLFFIFTFLFTFGLFAQPDFSGLKIMINPGHGGHDSDDRFIEETGFWESESNLTKGLYLREIMEASGAEIIMSRTTNTTADDLPLSQISGIANQNNVDFFHSIHSNGYLGGSNYVLVLFKGTTNNPVFPEAKEMAQLMWYQIFNNGSGQWSSVAERAEGDETFLGFNLGVLNGLSMPGTLSEGSFHDYIPESFRLMNLDFRRNESWSIARSFVEYYEKDDFTYGIVHGIARNKYETPPYYYIAGSDDQYAPINNIKATLEPGNLVYQGDEMNNGYYYFDSIVPGDYQLTLEAENFQIYTANITIGENQSDFRNVKMQYDTLLSPVINSLLPGDDTEMMAVNQEFTLNFNLPMNTESVENAFHIIPDTDMEFSWDENKKQIKAKPAIAFVENSVYTMNITPDAEHNWGVGFDDTFIYTFETVNRTSLSLVSSFPQNGQTEINTLAQMHLIFDLDITSEAVENIKLLDPSEQEVDITLADSYVRDGKAHYLFDPANALELNTTYTIFIGTDVVDIAGKTPVQDIEVSFTTIPVNPVQGNVIDDFEDIGEWQDPEWSGGTVGTNGEETTFEITSDKKVNGSHSAVMTYVFEGTEGGFCRSQNRATPNLGDDEYSRFGVWVYGDNSMNTLRFLFYNDAVSYTIPVIDTIDWSGWAFKSIGYSELEDGVSGDVELASLIVAQTQIGAPSGQVYFDDFQVIPDYTRNAKVLSHKPTSGDINLDGEVEIRFNLPMNTTSVESALTISPEVAVDFAWENDNKTLVITPHDRFAKTTTYTVTVATSATQEWDLALESEYTFDFTTTDRMTSVRNLKPSVLQSVSNYPNPFQNITNFTFNLNEAADVELKIYNLFGSHIATLKEVYHQKGSYSIEWGSKNLPNGVYIYQINVAPHNQKLIKISKSGACIKVK